MVVPTNNTSKFFKKEQMAVNARFTGIYVNTDSTFQVSTR